MSDVDITHSSLKLSFHAFMSFAVILSEFSAALCHHAFSQKDGETPFHEFHWMDLEKPSCVAFDWGTHIIEKGKGKIHWNDQNRLPNRLASMECLMTAFSFPIRYKVTWGLIP